MHDSIKIKYADLCAGCSVLSDPSMTVERGKIWCDVLCKREYKKPVPLKQWQSQDLDIREIY